MLSLSHFISLSLSKKSLKHLTLAEGARLRFLLCDDRHEPPSIASSSPCPSVPVGERNRRGGARAARTIVFFLTAGRRSPSPLPALWCPSFLAVTTHASRVRMRSSPNLFPPPVRLGSSLCRYPFAVAAARACRRCSDDLLLAAPPSFGSPHRVEPVGLFNLGGRVRKRAIGARRSRSPPVMTQAWRQRDVTAPSLSL